jgi:hypothetical protein
MSAQTVRVRIPEQLLGRFRRAAEEASQPLEAVILQSIEGNPPPPTLDEIPEAARPAISDLQALDDDGLWRVARSTMDDAQQARYQALLNKNASGQLTASDRAELDQLAIRADVLTIAKAYALSLLRWRGHPMPPVAGLRPGA